MVKTTTFVNKNTQAGFTYQQLAHNLVGVRCGECSGPTSFVHINVKQPFTEKDWNAILDWTLNHRKSCKIK